MLCRGPPRDVRAMTRPNFPRTLAEFQGRFAAEEDCRRYLVACRWPDGFRCPRCGAREAYEVAGRELLQCRSCRHQASVTAGTVLHRTHVPLRLWFAAAYLVTTHTPGFSAVQLRRQLGLARYETAWTMLHKLRRAMLRPERDRLSGVVEVDEAYVGGLEGGARRRAAARQRRADRRRRGRGARPRLGPRPAPGRRGPLRGLAGAVRRGLGRSGQHRADGRVAGLRPAAPGLRPPAVDGGGPEERVRAAPARPPHLLEPEDLAEGDPPRGEREAPAVLRRRVRVPVQPPAHADGGVPVVAGPLDPARADHPQDVVCG